MKDGNKGRDYYRAFQKKMKEQRKANIKYVWVSKLADTFVNGKVEKNPLNKGRTYHKGDKQ